MTSFANEYGIGKGAAQVFEPVKDNYAEQFKVKQYQEANREKKEAAIYSKLPHLDKIDIFMPQQKMFADKQQEIYDYTNKNIDKLRRGDAGATMEFQQMLSKFQNDAAMSKQLKEQYIKLNTPEAIKGYSNKTLDYMDKFKGYDEATGEFTPFDSKMIRQKVDLISDAEKNLKINPTVRGGESYNGDVKNSYDIKTNKQAAEQAMHNRLFNNPDVYAQAQEDFDAAIANKQTNAKDLFSYYKEIVSPSVVIDEQKYGVQKPQGSEGFTVGDGYMKNKNFSFAYQKGIDPKKGTVQTISIARNDAGENKELDFTNENGETVYGRPVEYKKTGNGQWVLNVVDKNGEVTSIPAEKVASKMKTNYDVSLDDLKQIAPDMSKSTEKSNPVKEVKRKGANGKVAIFNADTKQFIRYE